MYNKVITEEQKSEQTFIQIYSIEGIYHKVYWIYLYIIYTLRDNNYKLFHTLYYPLFIFIRDNCIFGLTLQECSRAIGIQVGIGVKNFKDSYVKKKMPQLEGAEINQYENVIEYYRQNNLALVRGSSHPSDSFGSSCVMKLDLRNEDVEEGAERNPPNSIENMCDKIIYMLLLYTLSVLLSECNPKQKWQF
ncbi:hypothetical protein ABPG72_011578 [Tetrahymena utriculariae]